MSDVETSDFLAAARRFVRAAGRRVADADEFELGELIALHETVDDAIAYAVAGQRARGVSWAGIGRATNTTRQAAQQRWGPKTRPKPSPADDVAPALFDV